ncbi:MAG: hydrogenase maturation protease [Thermoleophilaceae bacterium]|nr:hydrogenase maturation protease [Thermoleophilaceae bacterium]MEA2469094.1 hydrogenase maturation protease [Thermoleophilaceae bacterium]
MIVIGVGNSWRGDDAAGLEVARRLGGVCHEGDCTRLLEEWDSGDDVVVVDAASSGVAAAGTIHRFDAARQPLPTSVLASSTHALGLPAAMELARALGRLPRRLRVYGIEGASFKAGDALTPPVARGVDTLARELGAELDSSG